MDETQFSKMCLRTVTSLKLLMHALNVICVFLLFYHVLDTDKDHLFYFFFQKLC
jgi:hypothetical protein